MTVPRKKNRIRPVGRVLLDMEPLLFELCEQHELQRGEVLALVYSWINIHYPGAIEDYEDGGTPDFFYGYKEKHED